MSKLTTARDRFEATVRFAQATDLSRTTNDVNLAQACADAKTQNVTIFNALRTQILLRVARGNSSLVTEWLRASEFGEISDCESSRI